MVVQFHLIRVLMYNNYKVSAKIIVFIPISFSSLDLINLLWSILMEKTNSKLSRLWNLPSGKCSSSNPAWTSSAARQMALEISGSSPNPTLTWSQKVKWKSDLYFLELWEILFFSENYYFVIDFLLYWGTAFFQLPFGGVRSR